MNLTRKYNMTHMRVAGRDALIVMCGDAFVWTQPEAPGESFSQHKTGSVPAPLRAAPVLPEHAIAGSMPEKCCESLRR